MARRRRSPSISSRAEYGQRIATREMTYSQGTTEGVTPLEQAMALLSILEKSNSVIAGEPLTCGLDRQVATAQTDGESILFNHQMFTRAFSTKVVDGKPSGISPEQAALALIEIRGFNYHELGHVLFSPRRSSEATKQVRAKGDSANTHALKRSPFARHDGMQQVMHCWNVLEDTRMETFLIVKYPAVTPYLKYIVAKHIAAALILSANGANDGATINTHMQAQTENDWAHDYEKMRRDVSLQAFTLLYGRKFIDPAIRELAEKELLESFTTTDIGKEVMSAAKMEDIIIRLKKMIDRYRTLTFPKDAKESAQIVYDFWLLIHDELVPFGARLPRSGTGEHGSMTRGRPASASEQREIAKQIAESDAGNKTSVKSGKRGSSNKPTGPASTGKASSPSQSGSGSGSEADKRIGGPKDPHQQTAGTWDDISPSVRSDSPIASALNEEMREAQAQALADAKKMVARIREMARTEKYHQLLGKSTGNSSDAKALVVGSEYKAMSNAISQALTMLRADSDNQWERGVTSGRLNVSHVIKSRGTSLRAFDRWVDEGDDRPDSEVVILLDVSSSMDAPQYDYSRLMEIQSKMTEPDSVNRSAVYDATRAQGTVIQQATQAMWAIKYACQRNEIPCTVLAYNDGAHCVFSPSDRVQSGSYRTIEANGSTNPLMAAKIADYILSGSEAKSKLVFIITDGEWNGSSEAGMEALYESWKKKGYKAFVICLANGLTHTDVSAVWHPVTNPYIISVPSWYECLVKNEMKNYCGFTLRDVILAVNSRELARSIGRRIVKEVVGTKRHQ